MSENWKIQVSPRVGDTLINVRAETAEELGRLLEYLEQNATTIQSTIQALNTQGAVAASFPGSQNVQGPAPQAPPQQQGWSQQGTQQYQQPAAPQAGGQQQPPGPPAVCAHGPMRWKTGNGDNGPYQGWVCTAPRNDPNKCKNQWIR